MLAFELGGEEYGIDILRVQQRMLVLLGIEKLMGSADMGLLNSISH